MSQYADLQTAIKSWKGERSEIEAAAVLGVAPNTLGNWSDGVHLPPRTRIPSLAAALGMPVDDLAALVARSRQAKGKAMGKRDHLNGRGRSHVRGSRRQSAAATAARGQR